MALGLGQNWKRVRMVAHLGRGDPVSLGYIPLKLDDPNVILEKERETKAGFAECGCSNCKVEETSVIIRNLKHLDVNNFTSFLERPTDIPTPIRSDQSAPTGSSDERNSGACLVAEVIRPSATRKTLSPGSESFATHLLQKFEEFFQENYDLDSFQFTADEVFSLEDARAAVLATEKGFRKESLEAAVGGELNAEWIKMLHICIEDYVRSEA
ncbi:hypothetical protein Pst134EB_001505 [Puccinia striiformis f. sp. tritici]|nr:hypothetical protein Pst134EB_001505 [Puccinia striiformis f. sp. tritici]